MKMMQISWRLLTTSLKSHHTIRRQLNAEKGGCTYVMGTIGPKVEVAYVEDAGALQRWQ